MRLGHAAWKEASRGHGDRVRRQLDRYRGLEVTTTGDGSWPSSTERRGPSVAPPRFVTAPRMTAWRSAAGVHSGEVERQAGNVRGIAVHAVTRIAALAQPGEVLVSAPAVGLLEGSDLELEDAGEYEFKGLPGGGRPTASPMPPLTTASSGRQ